MVDILRVKRRAVGGAAGPPASLSAAEIAFNEQDRTLYYGLGNSAGVATSIIAIGGSGGFLPLAGGALTGNLTIGGTLGVTGASTFAAATLSGLLTVNGQAIFAGVNPAVNVNGAASTYRTLQFNTAGSTRWAFQTNAAAEIGANAGSDFVINRFSDAGASLGPNFTITRSTGALSVTAGLNLGSATAPGGALDLSRHLALYGGNYGLSITGGTMNVVAGGTVAVIPAASAVAANFTAAGMTMVGATDVTLARDPTAVLHAATKQYVDNRALMAVASIAALRAQTSPIVTTIYVQGYYAAADGGGGDYVRGSTGPADNGGSIIVTGNGTFYLQTYGAPLNVLQFGAKGDGATNDATPIQNCINAVQAAGGGVVAFPARTFAHSSTLAITQSGIRLIGAGHDGSHDYTPTWATNSNTRAITALLWTGADHGTQILLSPTGDVDSGGAIGGCAVLAMTLFAGTFPYTTAADFGVQASAVKDSEFEFFALEHKGAGLYFTCLNRNAAWNNGVSFCRIPYLGFRGVATAAGSALKMDGINNVGNAYDNVFGLINVLHNNGQAVDLWSCDNNTFATTRIQRVSGGAGAGVYFRPGAAADTPARANIFHLLSPGNGGVYSDGGGATTTFPPYENKILFYNPDENNAPAVPAIGQNTSTFKYSTLFYNTTKSSAGTYFSVTMPDDQTLTTGVWTKVFFDVVIDDPAFWYDKPNRRWWTRYPGAYFVSASIYLDIANPAGSRHIQILKNGATSIAHASIINRGNGVETLAVHASVFMTGTGDFIEVWAYQDSGVDAVIRNHGLANNNSNFFMGSRAG